MKKLLHVGCGVNTKSSTTKGFNTADWLEIRYDIDKSVNPDYVGSMTDMGIIDGGSVEGIFSSHNIEHLYAHEVPLAIAEFFRVLNDDGAVVVTCPDLKSVCELVVQDKLTESVCVSLAGPITPLDMLYGYRPSLQQGNSFMAHKCGFTEKVLLNTFQDAGFMSHASMSRGAPYFDLWGVITKTKRSTEELRELAEKHFPV